MSGWQMSPLIRLWSWGPSEYIPPTRLIVANAEQKMCKWQMSLSIRYHPGTPVSLFHPLAWLYVVPFPKFLKYLVTNHKSIRDKSFESIPDSWYSPFDNMDPDCWGPSAPSSQSPWYVSTKDFMTSRPRPRTQIENGAGKMSRASRWHACLCRAQKFKPIN